MTTFSGTALEFKSMPESSTPPKRSRESLSTQDSSLFPGPGDAFENISLTNLNTDQKLLAPQLWERAPALVCIIRRPGCAVCRDEARELVQHRSTINALGINMFCIVHQTDSWEDLSKVYWKGDVYLDEARGFYKALGKGKYVMASAANLANPFLWSRWSKARKKGVQETLTGEPRILGGIFILGTGGVYYSYLERMSYPAPLDGKWLPKFASYSRNLSESC